MIQQKNMKEFGLELGQKLKELMMEKKAFYELNYRNIGINTEDDQPRKESLKFLTLRININLVLQANNKLYQQLYLDECFYEL